MKNATPLLLKLLTEQLVPAALEKMKPGSLSVLDEIAAEILMLLPDFLVPRMTEVIDRFLRVGNIT